ncbi:hypothetical protein DFJ77DRAFT_453152 [Powellomyces hirtus]|nr:hypothetical protein DFJ77DRAFT_453152 [Powellomyces hirtus]
MRASTHWHFLLLLLGLLLNLPNLVSALPQKAEDINPYLPPANDVAPPPNIDCMVMWADYTCCASNMKTSKGTVLVQASGRGKNCPLSLERKEYCIVGDADCSTSGAWKTVRALDGGALIIALVGAVAAMLGSV